MTPKSRASPQTHPRWLILSFISDIISSISYDSNTNQSLIWIIACFAIQSSRCMIKIIAGTFYRPKAYVIILNWYDLYTINYLAYFPLMHALKSSHCNKYEQNMPPETRGTHVWMTWMRNIWIISRSEKCHNIDYFYHYMFIYHFIIVNCYKIITSLNIFIE